MRNRPASPHRRKRAVWADRVTQPESKAPASPPAPLTGRDLDVAVAKVLGYHVEKHAARYGPGYWLVEPDRKADLDGWSASSEAVAWEYAPAFSTDLYYLRQMTDWVIRQRCAICLSSHIDRGWYCEVSPWYDSPYRGRDNVLANAPSLPEAVSRAIVELAGLREAKEEEH